MKTVSPCARGPFGVLLFHEALEEDDGLCSRSPTRCLNDVSMVPGAVGCCAPHD